LSSSTGLSALVSTRIYPLKLPQTATYGALTYSKVSGFRNHVHGGSAQVAEPRFQVTAYHTSYSSLKSITEQVRKALDAYSGTLSSTKVFFSFLLNEVDLYDDETKVFYTALDFRIVHEEV
jgi:hypothetical protein